jgi:RNA polymerase sigma-70 factor, ECF subfamily
MEEDELLALLVDGDLDAFDTVMRRYQRLIYTVAYGFVRHREAALDVTQNVFLKAFRHRGTLRAGSNLKAWLTRIAYHESLNWRRGNRRHQEGHRDLDHLEVEPAAAADPEGEAIGRERAAALDRALLELHPRYRLALALRYRRGEPIRSIAESLACSEGAAKTLLSRALSQLRDRVARQALASERPTGSPSEGLLS